MGRGNRGDCRGVHALRGAILQRRVIPTEHLASMGKHKWSRPPALEAVPGLSRDAQAPEAANCSLPRVQGAWEGWDWGPVQRVAMGQEEGPGREQCGEGHTELQGPNMEPGDPGSWANSGLQGTEGRLGNGLKKGKMAEPAGRLSVW